MRVALDTSVLVAGSLVEHPHGPRARLWLEAIADGQVTGSTTTHGLAELWSTLTALPTEPRPSSRDITRLVDRLAGLIEVVDLTLADYNAAMARCNDTGSTSGALYDALHLVAAERTGADILLTFNTRHFSALSAGHRPDILAPPDPPRLVILG